MCRSTWHRTQPGVRDEIPPGRVHHRETNQCGPPAPANGYSTGPARTRGGADPGAARRQRIPCRPLSARGTLASYRAAPTSAVGLGLPTAGQARRERRVQGSLGLAPATAQDAHIPTAPGRPAPRRHPRRTAGGTRRARGQSRSQGVRRSIPTQESARRVCASRFSSAGSVSCAHI